jgi:hypothetical protein
MVREVMMMLWMLLLMLHVLLMLQMVGLGVWIGMSKRHPALNHNGRDLQTV